MPAAAEEHVPDDSLPNVEEQDHTGNEYKQNGKVVLQRHLQFS
jgi:hypothetical protein